MTVAAALATPHAPQPAASYGGTYTATTGEQVTVYASTVYGADGALPQRWANFLASLLHGPELETVTLYLAPPDEVASTCGTGPSGCYSQRDRLIVAPAEPGPSGVAPEAIVAHEYGHHLAASRDDAPWSAHDYGTKRWASYMNICSRTRDRELRPGATDLLGYPRNPAEAFAESYRILNTRRLGLPDTRPLVLASLLPDAHALELLEEDVTDPWTGPESRTFVGRVSLGHPARATVATPLDGRMRVTLSTARDATVALELRNVAGWPVARAT